MSLTHDSSARRSTLLILVSTTILLITMGIRQSTGLFVLPIIADTGLGIASISFALAVGQFFWGLAQPIFGAMADRYGAHRIVALGGLLLALGAAITPFATTEWGLLLTLGVIMAAGAGAGSFSILIGVTARGITPDRRSFAAGVINAGGSLGQFLFAPLVQLIIGVWSWSAGMYALALASLMTLPLAWALRGQSLALAPQASGASAPNGSTANSVNAEARLAAAPAADSATAGTSLQRGSQLKDMLAAPSRSEAASSPAAAPAKVVAAQTLREQLRVAMRDPSYLFLHAGFFTCGFHVAFLVTHFPGEVELCGLSPTVAANSLALIGLFNVAGSLGAGWLGQRYRMKHLLAGIYFARAALIIIFLLMPKTVVNIYLFAGGLGLTWLATVPPTAGIVGKLFDVRYLGTLFGLTLLSHQIGGFLGAWLGGVAMAEMGSYQWVWYADIALAVFAALINLPIREAKPLRLPRSATA